VSNDGANGFYVGDMLDAMENEDRVVRDELRTAAEERVRSISPPYVLDAERSVLSALLIDAEVAMQYVEESGLLPSDFYADKHRVLFESILDLMEKGRRVDAVSVADALNRRAMLDEIGGPMAISMIEAIMPGPASAAMHTRMVVDKSRLRVVAKAAASVLEKTRLGHSVDDVVEELELSINMANRARGGTTFANLANVAREAMDSMPALGAPRPGIKLGFADVDRLFRLVPGDLVIVAGRPSMGKTQFVVDVIKDVTVHRNVPTAFFSLEMTSAQVMTRLIGSECGIDLDRMKVPGHEMVTITGAAGDCAAAPLMLDDAPGVSIGDIRARARAAHRRTPLGLIVVDYLQLVHTEDTGNTATDVGRISKGLKTLARELSTTVVALSQLNRGVEMRADKRPVMSDLRESGAIEQDADVIAFLYREEYYAREKTPDDKRGVAEVIVGKNRKGPTGAAMVRFDMSIPRFTNLARDY